MDVTELQSLTDELGQPIIQQAADQQKAVRLRFIDDVNQLPVTRGLPHYSGGVSLSAPTLSTCFRKKGVAKMIAESRQSWRRADESHGGQLWVGKSGKQTLRRILRWN